MTSIKAKPHVVLVVDGDEKTANSVVQILNCAGLQCLFATSAEGALEMLKSSGLIPDILFTDVILPGMDGVTLIVQVKKQHPDCSVYVILGEPESQHLLDRAKEEGCDFELLLKSSPARELMH